MMLAVSIVGLLKAIEHRVHINGIDWIVSVDPDVQLVLVTTLIVLSGALLGLHFTAISVVASTAYSRAPGAVRSLIIHERAGNIYFRSLALQTSVATVMATVLCFHFTLGALNTIFISSLSIFSIFGFVILGLKTFDMFDSAFLVPYLHEQIGKAMVAVNQRMPRGKDHNFQDYFRRQAEELVGTYSNLVTIAASEDNLDRKALVKLGIGLFQLMRVYATQKPFIPLDSYWFKRRHDHKSWLLGSPSELDVALSTSTALRPDNTPDYLWIEKRLTQTLADIMAQLRKREELNGLASLAGEFRGTMELFGSTCSTVEAAYVYRTLAPGFRSKNTSLTSAEFSESRRPQAIQWLSIVELEGCALLSFVLEVTNQIEGISKETLEQILLRDGRTVFHPGVLHAVPQSLREEVNELRKKIAFESEVEGASLTPAWYSLERLGHRSCRVIADPLQLI
jgi:hypothetical protein